MADIKFLCPECRSKLGVDAKAAGYLVNCPDWGKRIQIPEITAGESGGLLTEEEIEFLSAERSEPGS